MRKLNMGWIMALALGLAVPSFSTAFAADEVRRARRADEAAASSAGSMSKDEQQKVNEHNKLRTEIKKVKYPAAKADIVSHVKGLKADDKKWFSDTLPDKTYGSADDVFSALGLGNRARPRRSKLGEMTGTGRRAGDVNRRLHATRARPSTRQRWRASSAGGSSSVTRRCSNRSTGATTRATRRWWWCRAIRASRSADFPSTTIRLAYLSVGEADIRAVRIGRRCAVSRSSSSRIPNGPPTSASTCGIRAGRSILLREEVPRLMQLRLRRADAGHHRHRPLPRDARTRRGSRARGRRCATGCAGCARRFPRAVVIANGGAALVDAAPVRRRLRRRGGVLDLRPRPARSTAPRPTPNGPGSWARSRARGRSRRKPVFSIEYADVGDVALSRWAFQEVGPPRLSSLRRGPRSQHRALNVSLR